MRPASILAIDPGNIASGWALIDAGTRDPLDHGKDDNDELRRMILAGSERVSADLVVIEMVGHYGTGMAAGKTVFDTCLWIGRFAEAVRGNWWPYTEPTLVLRPTIKTHHCGNPKAKDSNIRQALIDRFAPDAPNGGKGTKASPGWFYGFAADIWQAYALAVYAADELVKR